MNRHIRAAWWRAIDRMRPAAAPVFATGLGVFLATLILWRY